MSTFLRSFWLVSFYFAFGDDKGRKIKKTNAFDALKQIPKWTKPLTKSKSSLKIEKVKNALLWLIQFIQARHKKFEISLERKNGFPALILKHFYLEKLILRSQWLLTLKLKQKWLMILV